MKLEEKYPFIASWVVDGQIQIGQADSWHSYEPFAAVIDPGGVVWETSKPFTSLDALFDEMEKALGRWCKENGIELVDRQGNVIPFLGVCRKKNFWTQIFMMNADFRIFYSQNLFLSALICVNLRPILTSPTAC